MHLSLPSLVLSNFGLQSQEFTKMQPIYLMSDSNGINDSITSFILHPPFDFRLMTKGFSTSKHSVLYVFVVQEEEDETVENQTYI